MVEANIDESEEFLVQWGGPWVLTAIPPDGGKTETATFASVAQAREWIEERAGKLNIYFTVNPAMRSLSSKAKKTDIRGMRALHVDVDPRAGQDLDAERERAERALRGHQPPPTVIIDSGGGFQGFWMLEEEQATDGDPGRAAELEAYNLQLEVMLDGDSCHNIDRIMRLPGTINVPGEKKRKRGREPRLARIVEANWALTYNLRDFTAAPRVQTGSGSGPMVQLSGNLPRLNSLDELPEGVTARTKMLIVNGDDPDDPTKYPSRSEVLFAVLCQLVRAQVEDDMIASVILDPDHGISAHVLEQPRPQQYAARQIQRAHEEAIEPWLRRLNENHCVIEDIGGKCRIISEVEDPSMGRPRITRQSFDDFRNRYMHIDVVVGKGKEGQELTLPLGRWWLQNASRRQYRSLVFAPGREVNGCYNLWQGFACEAKPGDCSGFLNHLRDNVCRGDEEHYEYLLSWMARAVQQPDSPGEVAIVLRGRMGTGKSFAVKQFGSLWGRHFLQVSDSKHLVGSFNAHLRDCVVLFGDEAFYAGDKKHEAILKTMVTEEMIMIEGKGVDAEAAPNYVHLLMASNSDWVVPAGADERRYFVLDVGDKKMQDKSYFKGLRREMDSGGREALLHFLMTRDLGEFDVRQFPRTQALQDQKLLSMSHEEQWWYEKLKEGSTLTKGDGDWRTEVRKREVMEDYLQFAENLRLQRRLTPTAMGKFLQKVSPGGLPRTYQKTATVEEVNGAGFTVTKKTKVWHYELASLEACRDHWDSHFGGPYKWTEA